MTKQFLALVVMLCVAAASFASDAVDYKKTLSSVSILEMPAKAASLVKQADVKDREVVTSAVVTSAAAIKQTALPAVVGAISKAVPEMAATAASVAASAQPKLALDVAKAAAASAPEHAVEIAKAIGRVLPAQARNVALVIASVLPSKEAEVLVKFANEVSASTTTLAANSEGTTPPPRPPTVGAPYNPLPPGTPGQGSSTNAVPTDGRDYSAP